MSGDDLRVDQQKELNVSLSRLIEQKPIDIEYEEQVPIDNAH